jgi:hypothetical protein
VSLNDGQLEREEIPINVVHGIDVDLDDHCMAYFHVRCVCIASMTYPLKHIRSRLPCSNVNNLIGLCQKCVSCH